MQGFFEGRRQQQAAACIVAAVLIVGLAVLYVARPGALRRPPAGSPPGAIGNTAALRASADAGDRSALAALIETLDWTASPVSQGVVVADMLRSARPEVRAAACAWIGRNPEHNLIPLLVPRMSDADWRVRAAAFDAVRRVAGDLPGAPTSPAPLRDTPVDAREDVLFAWITGLRSAGKARPALPELCELYAPAGGHWLTGTRLAQSCFGCHAPPDPHPASSYVSCADCHEAAHAEWAGSSHARSTTHLNLLRVDEQTKQVVRVDPGPREGLVCTSCHVSDTTPASATPIVPGTEPLFMPHRFRAGGAAASCATCHAETQDEWETWAREPRPKPSTWLPGEFAWDEAHDTRTCVSCHMSERPAPPGGLAHHFAARRDAALMRGGLSAHIEPPIVGRGPQLVLTNLAGHRYPSGTIRRALRVELTYDDADPNASRLLTRLTDSTVPTAFPTQPALAPGEQRRLDLPAPTGALRVTCTITYERNQFEPGSYEVPLHTITERVAAPIVPAGR